jgi:hemin uptake protein HemP
MNARPTPLLAEPLTLIRDGVPVHDALALTEGGVQARIVLNGQVYSLRITRAGKLILTK